MYNKYKQKYVIPLKSGAPELQTTHQCPINQSQTECNTRGWVKSVLEVTEDKEQVHNKCKILHIVIADVNFDALWICRSVSKALTVNIMWGRSWRGYKQIINTISSPCPWRTWNAKDSHNLPSQPETIDLNCQTGSDGCQQ